MKRALLFFGLVFSCLYSLQAQQFVLPDKINFYQVSNPEYNSSYLNCPNARIWGWSNNGKVAYSIERIEEGSGSQIINFVIFDVVSDKAVFELEMDSSDQGVRDEKLYNLFKDNILKALQAHNIIRQKSDFLRFPLAKNDINYNSQIIDIKYIKDTSGLYDDDTLVVSKYKISVTADGKRKIINEFVPVHGITFSASVCGYVLSPYENRILVVVEETHRGFEGSDIKYRFSGCHLGTGFK